MRTLPFTAGKAAPQTRMHLVAYSSRLRLRCGSACQNDQATISMCVSSIHKPMSFVHRERKLQASTSRHFITGSSTSKRLKPVQVSLFPAGRKQAAVELPAIVLMIEASLILGNKGAMQFLDSAVQAGATMIVLCDSTSGAAAYDAGCKVKELLRNRAALLILDRTDIASAVEADGVILTEKGIPTVLAKKLLPSGLIGRLVSTADAAVTAAGDGASLVLMQASAAADVSAAKSRQRSGNAIPVLQCWTPGDDAAATAAADGLFLDSTPLLTATDASSTSTSSGAAAAVVRQMKQCMDGGGEGTSSAAAAVAAAPGLGQLIGLPQQQLAEQEKELLERVMLALQQAVPDLPELSLLGDALKRLDDLFLLVVVGEFNSGKSSLINALLGGPWLKEGVLPTTNEISVLVYGDDEAANRVDGQLVQKSDGLYVRYLPAPLLSSLHIVDTPGTNVILTRQQRLTEEYVPRADLVLFVMSADRPCSDSEIKFLEYIRQWKKKVVFAVNKVDLLPTEEDVDAVTSFVSDNACSLLSIDSPCVLTVSSRLALAAKLRASVPGVAHEGNGGGIAPAATLDRTALARDPEWRASGFAMLEEFVYSFLLGEGGRGGGESVRLKLQTPLSIAEALIDAAGRKLDAELAAAKSALAALSATRRALVRFGVDLESDSRTQRNAFTAAVNEIVARTDAYVDATIQFARLPGLLPSLLMQSEPSVALVGGYERDVVGDRYERLRAAAAEHSSWLAANVRNGRLHFAGLLKEHTSTYSRAASATPQSFTSPAFTPSTAGASDAGSDAAAAAAAAAGVSVPLSPSSLSGSQFALATTAAGAVAEFSPKSAAALLDHEIRDTFLGTAATALGAPSAGLLAAGYLATTLEDALALGLGGAASYVAVVNLPLRRSEIKVKVARIAANFGASVTGKMEEELGAQVSTVISDVESQLSPLESGWASREAAVRAHIAELADLRQQCDALGRVVANLE